MSNEPFYFNGIGTIRCPTLRDIRHVTYDFFTLCLSAMTMTSSDYMKTFNLDEQFNKLNEDQRKELTLYNLFIWTNAQLLRNILDLFFVEEVEFNPLNSSYDIFTHDCERKIMVGSIVNSNFEMFRNEMKFILGLSNLDEDIPKYKNERARKMAEKIRKHVEEKALKQDDDFLLDNKIRKYCTYNNVGINIFNIWDMTYYQFSIMFQEYYKSREVDFNDLMAAHSFSYKKASEYKPMNWIKNK